MIGMYIYIFLKLLAHCIYLGCGCNTCHFCVLWFQQQSVHVIVACLGHFGINIFPSPLLGIRYLPILNIALCGSFGLQKCVQYVNVEETEPWSAIQAQDWSLKYPIYESGRFLLGLLVSLAQQCSGIFGYCVSLGLLEELAVLDSSMICSVVCLIVAYRFGLIIANRSKLSSSLLASCISFRNLCMCILQLEELSTFFASWSALV